MHIIFQHNHTMKKLCDRSGESFPINITADELKNVTISTLDSWLSQMGEKPDEIKTMKRREKEQVLLAMYELDEDEKEPDDDDKESTAQKVSGSY